MIDLSLNEVEALAAKAARGAGFSWGLAEEIGRAARRLAAGGEDWDAALLALAQRIDAFEAPDPRRVGLWRKGADDAGGGRPLCPVRTAAVLLDDPPDAGVPSWRIGNVGLPVWLDAMLRPAGFAVGRPADPLAAGADVLVRRTDRPAATAAARRGAAKAQALAELNALAARTYVPESERSRKFGAGGGRVDDE